MPTSSIDDLLMGGKTSLHPETPENQHIDEPEEIEESEHQEPEYGDEPEPEMENDTEHAENEDHEESEGSESVEREFDEYGNEKKRMSKGMKERLDRKERQHQKEIEQHEREIDNLRAQLSQQGASREVQQAAKDFEYDPDANGDWQQQLASFVKQTVNSMTLEQNEAKTRHEEAQVHKEFEVKFREGMGRFGDFRDVINSLPFEITNPMTLATRAMQDPAAFLYAAAKRNPQELERISKIRDPYAQMTEIGKLEERMRRNKPTTKAPRPLGRTNEDSGMPAPKKKSGEESIEDLIARADAKKLARVKGRPGGRR